jgi:hypothetical protein
LATKSKTTEIAWFICHPRWAKQSHQRLQCAITDVLAGFFANVYATLMFGSKKTSVIAHCNCSGLTFLGHLEQNNTNSMVYLCRVTQGGPSKVRPAQLQSAITDVSAKIFGNVYAALVFMSQKSKAVMHCSCARLTSLGHLVQHNIIRKASIGVVSLRVAKASQARTIANRNCLHCYLDFYCQCTLNK